MAATSVGNNLVRRIDKRLEELSAEKALLEAALDALRGTATRTVKSTNGRRGGRRRPRSAGGGSAS